MQAGGREFESLTLHHFIKNSAHAADPEDSGNGVLQDPPFLIGRRISRSPQRVPRASAFCMVRQELTEGGICKSQHFIKNDVPAA